MKEMRGLLIAAVVLAALGGLAWFSNKHKEDEAKKPAPDAAPKILTLDEKQIDEVRLAKAGSEPVVLTRIADRWEITKPEPMPADQEVVSSILSTASALTSDRLIEEKPSGLGPFGLATPDASVTLHLKNGKSSTLRIGSDTPGGSATYVKLDGDPRVFSIASSAKSNLEKSVNELRDKRLLTFNSDKLSRVELISKGPAVEFGKNGQNDWQILKPEPMRADALKVDDLVRKLKEAKIQLDGGQVAAATFSAAPRVAIVKLTDNSGTQTAEFHEDQSKNTYAKSSVITGIYKVGADVADALSKTPADFRNKKLFDFGFSELSQLTLPAGSYTKSGDKWFLTGKEMDSSSVLSVVDKLRDLTATGFAAKSAGAVIFEAGTQTQDKKRTEKVVVTREGGNTFARRDGEPAIYTLDSSAVDDLMKAARDVKPAAPAKPPAKK